MEIFSERLKWLRERKGYTQKIMAELINMTQSSYSKYEYNLREPKLETLSLLPDILDESVDFMIGVTDFTRNCDIIYNQFLTSLNNLSLMRRDLEIIVIDPVDHRITSKDFDPESKESVLKKIDYLNKHILLWEDRMEQCRTKLLNILDQTPAVKESTFEKIRDLDTWIYLISEKDTP